MAENLSKSEKKWLKYIEILVAAYDMALVADQTRENRAAAEAYHLGAVMLDNLITYEEESAVIKNFVGELKATFDFKMASLWGNPPEEGFVRSTGIFDCGVELKLRELFIEKWTRFRTKDFKQQIPFNLDIKTGMKILRTVTIIVKIVKSKSNDIEKGFNEDTLEDSFRQTCTTEGFMMYAKNGATIDAYIKEIPEVFKIYLDMEDSEDLEEDILKMKDMVKMIDAIVSQASTGRLDCGFKGDYNSYVFERLGEKIIDLVTYLGGKSKGVLPLFSLARELAHPLFVEIFKEANLFKTLGGQLPKGTYAKVKYHTFVQERVLRGLFFSTISRTAEEYPPGSRFLNESPNFYIMSFLRYYVCIVEYTSRFCESYEWLQGFNASVERVAYLRKHKDHAERYSCISKYVFENPKAVILSGGTPKRVKDDDDTRLNRLIFLRKAAIRMRNCSEMRMEKVDLSAEEEEKFYQFVRANSENRLRRWGALESEPHPDARDDLLTVLTHFLG